VFGLEGVSGVGFSFGVDRIYDVLDELKLFPEEGTESARVMIGFLDPEGMKQGLKALSEIRARGLSAEIYPDVVKLKKKLNYADKKSIPYVLIFGPEEMAQQKVRLKDMKTGEQKVLTFTESLEVLQAG